MLGVNRILVAIDRTENTSLVLEKAIQLAKAADAELEVVRVIYEGMVDLSVHDVEQSQTLKTFVMQAEESYLEDLIEPFLNQTRGLVSLTLWNRDTWQGIIDAAEDYRADLIIKAANIDEDAGSILHTPQDWNLMRHSQIPVMLIKPEAWMEKPVIFAAVDATREEQQDLNIKVLKEAGNLAEILDGELHVVSAYPITEPWAEPSPAGINFERVRQEVEAYVQEHAAALIEKAGVRYKYLYVEEGKPASVIREVVDSANTEILVIGTVARGGIRGIILGNTSEAILHRTLCDVVVLR